MKDKRISRVGFADEKLLQAFEELKQGKFEEKQLSGQIAGAIRELKENPFTGTVVPKKLWPKEYVKKYAVNNLRKYDLPQGWRLVYTLRGNEIEIISVIIEWFSHKNYSKRFGYKKK